MMVSAPRKRGRDVDDDFDLAYQPIGKRARPFEQSGDTTQSSLPTSQNALGLGLVNFTEYQHQRAASPDSIISEAGSASDLDMDLDTNEDRITFSTSPDQLPSWNLRPAPTRTGLRSAGSQPSPRIPTPVVNGPARPKLSPIQSSGLASPSRMRSKASDTVPRSTLSNIITDRLPSPVVEDEPHTPTTAAGSQLSLLSVNDMDVDDNVATPVPSPSDIGMLAVRRQRQRSGAFISTPEAARKFSMGYRADCQKCQDRVPGHMNHFLGTS